MEIIFTCVGLFCQYAFMLLINNAVKSRPVSLLGQCLLVGLPGHHRKLDYAHHITVSRGASGQFHLCQKWPTFNGLKTIAFRRKLKCQVIHQRPPKVKCDRVVEVRSFKLYNSSKNKYHDPSGVTEDDQLCLDTTDGQSLSNPYPLQTLIRILRHQRPTDYSCPQDKRPCDRRLGPNGQRNCWIISILC